MKQTASPEAEGSPSGAGGAPPKAGVLAAPLTGGSVFAGYYFLIAFQPGILRSDDFGYLRSVIETLRHGRPYTYDWLAPYGATMSSLCAGIYRLSGSFYLSTYGFQALCALAVFILLYRLLAKRVAPWSAAALTLVFTTFPLFFSKAADFHGSTSTLALFLMALLFFEAGKPALFFLASFLAFANRQSHVALLILPVLTALAALLSPWRAALMGFRGDGPDSAFSGWKTWLWTGAFLAAAAGLHLRMNKTYAMAHAVFTDYGSGRLPAVTLALLAGCFVTMAFLAVFRSAFNPPWKTLAGNLKRPALPIAASAVLLIMSRFWPPTLVLTDTPLFGYAGWPQVNAVLPWIISVCIWFLDFRMLKPSPYLAVIGGFILIASLRGIWWDYYFLEIMVLCLLMAAGGDSRRALPWLRTAPWILALVLIGNFAYGYLFRVQMDKQKLSVTVLERLDREGRISVDRMSSATFGYLGWKLFDYFLANEGREYRELPDFLGYVRKERISIETHLPWRRAYKGELPPGAELLESGTFRIGFTKVAYRVSDLHGPGGDFQVQGRFMTLDSSRYRSPRFPLNDREWKAWLDSLPGL
ncbi:MAG: hypothetical protein M3Y08_10085 [Fibrobacterota bacterium]|nr:hypothetical protein [Fibrobacterota bacterium]